MGSLLVLQAGLSGTEGGYICRKSQFFHLIPSFWVNNVKTISCFSAFIQLSVRHWLSSPDNLISSNRDCRGVVLFFLNELNLWGQRGTWRWRKQEIYSGIKEEWRRFQINSRLFFTGPFEPCSHFQCFLSLFCWDFVLQLCIIGKRKGKGLRCLHKMLKEKIWKVRHALIFNPT